MDEKEIPPPDREDFLSPARERRETALSSRTERAGNSTPDGPVTSPPVDEETT